MTSFSTPKFPFSMVFKMCWNIQCFKYLFFLKDFVYFNSKRAKIFILCCIFYFGWFPENNNSSQLFFLFKRPIKMEQSECPETSANHPKEIIQHLKQGGSLKSVTFIVLFTIIKITIIYYHFPSNKHEFSSWLSGCLEKLKRENSGQIGLSQNTITEYITMNVILPKCKELLAQILWEGFT